MAFLFDRLAPSAFEDLVQALLAAEFNADIEAWGRTHDWGRDAYFDGTLPFPSDGDASSPPFLFQVKFLGGAATTGADRKGPLKGAITSDCSRNEKRNEEVQTYVLITNAPMTGNLRKDLEDHLLAESGANNAYVRGKQDVEKWLHNHQNLLISFPKLLGGDQVFSVLRNELNRAVGQRTKAVLEQTLDFLPKFVATGAFERLFETLQSESFAVLEGPPEVGKTSAARALGAVLTYLGWEYYEVHDPDEFFRVQERNTRQYFVADDAFGRTEYDPEASRRWARNLDQVLARCSDSCWFAWTTRRHILRVAEERFAPQGEARSFPEPGDVLVKMDDITVRECALMLYEHAQQADLSDEAVENLKENAYPIADHTHITPERIRRLIDQRLEEIVSACQSTGNELSSLLDDEIRDPTVDMRQSFQSLSKSHQFGLFATLLLDTSARNYLFSPHQKRLSSIYNRLSALTETSICVGISRVVADLNGTFLTAQRDEEGHWKSVAWIHPSVRDMIIEHLIEDAGDRNIFLKAANVGSLRLAIAEGGSYSRTNAPLLHDQAEAEIICNRLIELIRNSDSDSKLQRLLRFIEDASPVITSSGMPFNEEALLEEATSAISSGRIGLSADTLELFYELTESSNNWIEGPDLTAFWEQGLRPRIDSVSDRTQDVSKQLYDARQVLRCIRVLERYAPRFLSFRDWTFPTGDRFEAFCEEVRHAAKDVTEIAEILRDERDEEHFDELESDLDRLQDAVECLSAEFPRHWSQLEDIRNAIEDSLDEIHRNLESMKQSEPEEHEFYEYDWAARRRSGPEESEAERRSNSLTDLAERLGGEWQSEDPLEDEAWVEHLFSDL